MRDLHLRTSQAVHHYFEANGAAYPRAFDLDVDSDADHDDQDENDANVDPDDVSVWNDGSPDLDESDDEEILSAGINKTLRQSAPPLSRCIGLARGNAHAVSRDDTAAASCARTALASANNQPREPAANTATQKQGHLPVPLVRKGKHEGRAIDEVGPQDPETHQTRAANDETATARTATPPPPPPAQLAVEARGPSEAQAPTSSYHVRLVISMATTEVLPENPPAYQMVTTIARPSLYALLGAAAGYIRTMPVPDVAGNSPTLRARVKRAQMGDSMWDMGGYWADDMRIFFPPGPHGPALPLFEIEVEETEMLNES